MPFPTGWPPPVPSTMRCIRFFVRGTTTALFSDNAYLFVDGVGANTYIPLPNVLPGAGVSNSKDPGPHVVPAIAGTGVRGDDPHPAIWATEQIRVVNWGGADVEFSFDGLNVHGIARDDEDRRLWQRHEAGIALRGGVDEAVGSITTVAVANLVDGEKFILHDGINPPVVFEFDVTGNGVAVGNVNVDVSVLISADDVRDAIVLAVSGVGAALRMTATNGGAATVTLTQDDKGPQGNTTQSTTVLDPGFVITDMLGGTGVDFTIEAW